MAIFHLNVQIIGRSSGRSSLGAAAYRAADRLIPSAVAAAAYRSGGELEEKTTSKIHDYTKKTGVVHTEIIMPAHAPKEYSDRNTLWNAVEESEKRKDAQTAREVMVALPKELTLDESIALLHTYIQSNFIDSGMIADFAIHDKNDGNPHSHIMLTTRDVTESGFGNKNREWNKVEHLEQWRANWADCCNAKLQEKGLDDRIDHRTLEAQGIDREPTIHVGHCPARAVINEQIKKRNEEHRPANVAGHMNNLIDKYENLSQQLRETATKTREIKRLNYRIEDIRSRAIEITQKRNELAEALQEREKLKFWQSKKEMNSKIDNLTNSERNARDFFIQAFGFEFDCVSREIEKLEQQAEALKTEDTDMKSLYDEQARIKFEYKSQRVLAETRPDVREILARLKQAPKPLQEVTDEDYDKIEQVLKPSQRLMLQEMRREKERERRDRGYERGR